MIPDCGLSDHRISEYCAASVSLIANLGLILLIAHWLINSGWLFIVHNGFIGTTSPANMFSVFGVYQLALYTAILSITLPFIYRYCLICRDHDMSSPMIFLVISFNISFAALIPVSCRVYLYPVMEQAFAEDPLISERLSCRHAAGQIPVMQMRFTMETLIPTTVVAAVSNYTYVVILTCSYKIWKKLSAQASRLSQRTASLHRQLNKMLLVQALSPFLVAVVPLCISCVAVYNGTENAETLAYVNTAMSWIPVINSLSTLYFVKDYRNAIIGIVGQQPSRTMPLSEGRESDRR